jgi:hypothetical protein
MSFQNERDLARLAATSLDHIAASHRACQDSAVHVRSSREAIDRSLELLSATSVYNTVAGPNLDGSGAGGDVLDEAA